MKVFLAVRSRMADRWSAGAFGHVGLEVSAPAWIHRISRAVTACPAGRGGHAPGGQNPSMVKRFCLAWA
jgi:hypothetical protein